jgi:phage virion morphogenesis protein
MRITVGNNSQQVLDVLRDLLIQASDPRPVLQLIGEHLAESTKERFVSGTGPEDNAWAENRPITLAMYLCEYKGNFKKDGSLSKKGQTRLTSKKPLTGKTRELQNTIGYLVSGDSLMVGSPLSYAAMQQFGGKTAANSMIPDKTIPARPFLGLSTDDEATIIDIVSSYLAVS